MASRYGGFFMKIALVAQHATPFTAARQAGDDIRLRELSRSLASKGHHVTVYASTPGPARAAEAEQHPGVRVEYVGPPANRDDAGLLARVPAFAAPLRDRWERERPDVVHALRWTSGLAALAATRDLRIPVVQSFNSLGVTERRHHLIPSNAGTERIRLEPAIGRSASAVVATSSAEETDLTRLGVPRRSINVIPCGVDTEEFAPEGPAATRDDRPRLVTVTELDRQEELATLLRALSKVPEAELVVVGGPPQAEIADDPAHGKLAKLAAELGVVDRLIFTGRVSYRELPPLLRSADLLVAMSEYDPVGMACLEAMACGTPVVASAAGSHADAVVDGATGILVPPGRPALLAQRIRQLLAHPMLLSAFSVAGADRARSRYSWDRIAGETLAVYDRALAA
jgi:glycosyltransferase involved in cell wall biosynthesis